MDEVFVSATEDSNNVVNRNHMGDINNVEGGHVMANNDFGPSSDFADENVSAGHESNETDRTGSIGVTIPNSLSPAWSFQNTNSGGTVTV